VADDFGEGVARNLVAGMAKGFDNGCRVHEEK
jgi:hypothetical protein